MAPTVIEYRGISYEGLQGWLDRNDYEGPRRWWAEDLLTHMDTVYRREQKERSGGGGSDSEDSELDG